MSGQFDRQALEIYTRALDIPFAEREAFLRQAAGDSAELLEILLSMHGVGENPGQRLASVLAASAHALSDFLSLEGLQLGDFRLLRQVGRGASGNVYEAEQLSLRRRVAVKVLNPLFSNQREIEQRFEREAEILAKLSHPNIVRVISTAMQGELRYFAMEFVHGSDLHSLIAKQRSRPAERVEGSPLDLRSHAVCAGIVELMASALHHAHEQGVLHRDVKPHNILIDTQGKPKLSDFGLAKAIDRTALTSAMGDGIRGTLAYMSPEQARDLSSAGERADIYSLGAVLYELLTLRPVFEAQTAVEMLHKIEMRDPVPAHRANPTTDLRLSAICSRALEKDPQRRYSSAREFEEELRRFLEGKRVRARPVRLQVGEHRLDRRALLRRTLAASVLVGGGVIAASSWLNSRPKDDSRPRLRLELPPGRQVQSVRVVPLQPPFSLPGPVEEQSVRGASIALGPFEPGAYRFVVIEPGGAFAELHRTLRRGESLTARAYPSALADRPEGMAFVRAGTVAIERAFLSVDEVGEVELSTPPFWIDRAAVTNREYREFLEATGRWPSPAWPSEWLDVWEGRTPRRPDWDELPVVMVDWESARAFAEWKGKRLPSVQEWLLAQGLDWREWLAPESFERLAQSFVVGRPSSEPWAEGSSAVPGRASTLAAYLRHVAPARLSEERAAGEHRLWHSLGNVSQWLSNEQFFRTEAGGMESGQMRLVGRVPWHFDSRKLPLPPLSCAYSSDAAGDIGFRCAKSVSS